LSVDRVDFLGRFVDVDRQLVVVKGAPPTFGPLKTDASRRRVPLPTIVGEALAAHIAEFPPGERGLIFTNERGRPMRRNRFGEVWRPAVVKAGLREGTRFHDLRHYYASLLIRRGASVKAVQSRLGHASATETLNTYAHLWPDDEDRTRVAIDDEFSLPTQATMGWSAP
jgi:integrase